MVPEPPAILLTPAEVASRLAVHRETVYRLIQRGELPAVRVGSLLRVPANALAVYLTRGAHRG